ncbi:MAG: exonuclease domain-containing protein [Steroidobacteraceae bacterium]
MTLVVLDTETTGLSRKKDRVVEVAACRIDAASGGVIEEFHRYVNPGMLVPPTAVKIHGITNAFLADKPRFKDIASDLAAFLDGSTIVIHNAPFDTGFLSAEYRNCGAGSFESIPREIVCSKAMARSLTKPRQSVSLDALCDLFGIDRSSRIAAGGASVHGALIDCRLLAQVYVRLRALKEEQDARLTAMLPFPAGNLPSGIEDLAKGYVALDQAMKPLRDELKRIEGAIKAACHGVPYTGNEVTVRFSAQIRTDWDAIRKKYLSAVDLSPYQSRTSRMKVEVR